MSSIIIEIDLTTEKICQLLALLGWHKRPLFGNCIHQGDQSILCMHRIPMKDNEENSIETTNTKSYNGISCEERDRQMVGYLYDLFHIW